MRSLLTGILLSGCILATASESNTISIPMDIGAPSLIDGVLDEQCWQKAYRTGEFTNLKPGEKVKEKTEALFFADKDHLYIAMICNFHDLKAKEKEILNAGNKVFGMDVAELFLDPGATGSYSHLAVSAAGNFAGIIQNQEIKYAIQVNPDNWTLEMRIPFSSLKLPQDAKFTNEWTLNFARGNWGQGRENVTWAPLKDGTFHDSSKFIRIKGIPANLNSIRKEQALQNAGTFQISTDKDLYSDSDRTLGIEVWIKEKLNDSRLKVAVVRHSDEKEIVNMTKNIPVTGQKNMLVIPFNSLRQGRYELAVIWADKDGKVLESAKKTFWRIADKKTSHKNVIRIKDHNFYKNGDYFFPIFTTAGTFTEENREETFRRRETSLKELREHGFNAVTTGSSLALDGDIAYLKENTPVWHHRMIDLMIGYGITPKESLQAWAEAGLMAIPQMPYIDKHGMLEDDRIDAWVHIMTKFREYDNILFWSTSDEMDPTVNANKHRHKLYKEMDPDRYTWINVINAVAQNKNAADILSTDPYPIPKGRLTAVAAHTDRLLATVRGNPEKSAIIWLQMFGDGPKSVWSRPPTPEELRAMVYLALTHGIKGIGYWVYNAPPRKQDPSRFNEETFASLKILHKEIKELAPILNLGKRLLLEQQGPLDINVTEYEDNIYIIAINTDNKTLDKTILKLPPKVLDGTAELPYEKRRCTVRKQTVTDSFEPFQVHVYRLTPSSR